MAIFIHADASQKPGMKLSRGAYIIERKIKKGSTPVTTHKHVFRTKILEEYSTRAETITLVQGLIHALILFPEEERFEVFCDCNGALNLLKTKYLKIVNGTADELLYKLINAIDKHHKADTIEIVANKVTAHKGTLSDYGHKMNFICDYLCSFKGDTSGKFDNN